MLSDEECARILDGMETATRRPTAIDWTQCHAEMAAILSILDRAGLGASAAGRHLADAAAAVAAEARRLAA